MRQAVDSNLYISNKQASTYELFSSRWFGLFMGWCPFDFLTELFISYHIKKGERKFARYKANVEGANSFALRISNKIA